MSGAKSAEKPCAERQPPTLNNMGGQNPHTGKKTKIQEEDFWAGIDQLTLTLFVNFDIYWDPKKGQGGVKKGIRPVLVDAVEVAREERVPVKVPEMGGVRMHPKGGTIAKKFCRFRIELPCAMIIVDDAMAYTTWPNVKVEINGIHCLCYPGGALAAYREALGFIEAVLCGKIEKERVSRVDLAADFPGWSMDEFIEAASAGHVVCRSKVYHPYLKPGGTSLNWGVGDVMLRIYDKVGELHEKALKGEPVKIQYMIARRWGGVDQEQAIRVEYQLRREKLKELGVTDFDSLMECHGDILRFLTGIGATTVIWDKKTKRKRERKNMRWFRFLTKKPDHKHPERNKTRPIWERVQNVFLKGFGLAEPLEEIEPGAADVEILVKQAFGVMETAACNHGYAIPGKECCAPAVYSFAGYEAFEAWICAMFRNVATEKGWLTAVDRQKLARRALVQEKWNERKARREVQAKKRAAREERQAEELENMWFEMELFDQRETSKNGII